MTVKEAYKLAQAYTRKDKTVNACYDLGDEYAFHFGEDLIGGYYDTVNKKTGELGFLATTPDNIDLLLPSRKINIKNILRRRV